MNEVYEKCDTDLDSNAVDDMFNKCFGKSVRISDQIEVRDEEDVTQVEDISRKEDMSEEKDNGVEDCSEELISEEPISEEPISEQVIDRCDTSDEAIPPKDVYPDEKNPFDDEEGEEEEKEEANTKVEDNLKNSEPVENQYPDDKNPFGDEEEDEEEIKSSVRIRLRTPSDALNPFADEEDDEEVAKHEINSTPKPKPRQSLAATSSPSSAVSSPTSSIRSRKKRPAPTPPNPPTPTTLVNTPTSIPPNQSSCSLSSSFAVSGESSRRDSLVSCVSSDIASSVPNSRTPTPLPRHRKQKSADDLSADELADIDGRSRHQSGMNSSVRSNDSDTDLKSRSASDLRPVKKRPAPPIPAVKRIVKGSLAEIESELNSIGDRLPVIEEKSKELEESLLNSQNVSSDEQPVTSAEETKSDSTDAKTESKVSNQEVMNEFLATARERCRLARRQKELMYM